MNTPESHHFTLLDDLDARQDDVLNQLDDLNNRLEALLSQFGTRTAAAMPAVAGSDLALATAENPAPA